MTPPLVDVSKRGFRAPGTTFLVAGSLISALGAYLFQWYGTQVFDPKAFGPISALWTLFFILATVLLVPVEQYVTREVARGRKSLPRDLSPALVMIGACTAVGVAFVLVTRERVFAGDYQYVAQIFLLCVGYGFLFVGKGILAGSRRFQDVGWVMVIESLARLAAGILLIQLVMSATSMGWAMVIGAFAVMAMAWWRHDRGSTDIEAWSAGKFLRGYVAGSAPAQVLLAGAPLAVIALGGDLDLASVTFITFTLYRAPMTLIFAMQGRLLPYLVGLSDAGDHHRLGVIVRRVVTVGAALSVLGGLVGWFVGPEVVSALYGEEYGPARLVAALVAAGVTAASTAQITSQVLVAEGRTRLLGYAWTAGLATAAVVAVLVPGPADIRVAVGFVSGEAVALGTMAMLAVRR